VLAVLCWGLNAFSKPESRAIVVSDFTVPLVLEGGGGNAIEPAEDTSSLGRVEAVASALAKSNWSSKALPKGSLFPGAVGAVPVPGRSPNALSKSVTVAGFGVSVEDTANGEVDVKKGLLSFAGGGKGLVLWTSAAATTPVKGGNVVSAVV
jgi:hypothetical protein